MAETYRRYPGFEQNSVSNEADGHLENLKILGYSVMKNVLTQDFSAYLEKRLLDLWDEQDEEFGRTRLEELGERGTHRGLLTKDKEFTDLVVHPRVLDVIYGVLGETAILNLQNASAAFPGQTHFQSAMHRDFAKDFVSEENMLRALAMQLDLPYYDRLPLNDIDPTLVDNIPIQFCRDNKILPIARDDFN
ncbi:MAG: hypothetical protein EOP04_18310, partial [Proteobacteria bacterium]